MDDSLGERVDEALLLETEKERRERIKADFDELEKSCMMICHDERLDLQEKKFFVETRIRFFRFKYPTHPMFHQPPANPGRL